VEPVKGHPRLEVDARVAWGVPLMWLPDDTPLGDSIARQLPFALGAGVRSARGGTFVGASFAYGVLAMKEGSSACPAGWSKCGGHHIRVGIDFIFHLRAQRSVDPWVGFRLGYQRLSYHASLPQPHGELTDTTTLKGFVLVDFETGVDFALGQAWAIGPFFQVTTSRFDDYSVERTGTATASASGA
jgi:hypothetical protein